MSYPRFLAKKQIRINDIKCMNIFNKFNRSLYYIRNGCWFYEKI